MSVRSRRQLVGLLLGILQTVAADWQVTIDGVYGQSIDFSTGDDSGATMKVELYDVCRVDSAYRTELGELYPSNDVDGLYADDSAVDNDPGCCNKISYAFTETLNQTGFYTDNGDDTATVAFCAQVALYEDSTLVNLAEVRVEYLIDLGTQDVFLETYTITDAAGYTDASDVDVTFDGSLETYFCDPNSFDELYDDGHIMEQGSILSVCFRVPDGQFEISDVMYLTVKNAADSDPSQDIIIDSYVAEDGVALKTCTDNGNSDTNVCVVQFILKADFYETSSITLTGFGMVLLELGDSPGSRQLSVVSNSGAADDATASFADSAATLQEQERGRRMQGMKKGHYVTKPFQVKALGLSICDSPDKHILASPKNGSKNINLLAIIFAATGIAGVVLTCMCLTKKTPTAEREIVFDKQNDVQNGHHISLTDCMDDSGKSRKPFDLDRSGLEQVAVCSTVKKTIPECTNQAEQLPCPREGKRIIDV